MQLYTYFRSSAAYRVRIALNLKGLDYDARVVWLPDNEQSQAPYRAVNPHGLVPTLVDGEKRIGQSLAIIEYLDEIHPDTPLLPGEPFERAQVRALALLVACDIHPVNNLRILNYLKGPLGQSADAVNTWYQYWCQQGLAAFEQDMMSRSPGQFVFGDHPTLADICLIPQVFNAQRFNVDMSAYPNVMRVNDRCLSMEAFATAAPAAQPEAS